MTAQNVIRSIQNLNLVRHTSLREVGRAANGKTSRDPRCRVRRIVFRKIQNAANERHAHLIRKIRRESVRIAHHMVLACDGLRCAKQSTKAQITGDIRLLATVNGTAQIKVIFSARDEIHPSRSQPKYIGVRKREIDSAKRNGSSIYRDILQIKESRILRVDTGQESDRLQHSRTCRGRLASSQRNGRKQRIAGCRRDGGRSRIARALALSLPVVFHICKEEQLVLQHGATKTPTWLIQCEPRRTCKPRPLAGERQGSQRVPLPVLISFAMKLVRTTARNHLNLPAAITSKFG